MVNDFDNLEILLILLWKFTELLLFDNCWRAKKIWSASIVARLFSLQNYGWLLERYFFGLTETVLGEQYMASSWTPVIMSCASSRPGLRVIWLWKMLASRWKSLWEWSSFVPWLVPYASPDVSVPVPEWPWTTRFRGKSSRWNSAHELWLSVLLIFWDKFFVTLFWISSDIWVIWFSCDVAAIEFCANLLLECSS